MAKGKTAGKSGPNWATPRFKGKTVAFTGWSPYDRKQAAEFVKSEGGQVVENLTAEVDYLVVGPEATKAAAQTQQKALRLNQKQGASIQTISDSDFYDLFKPTAEEAVAMLKGGKKGRERWNRLAPCWEKAGEVALKGTNFRGADLTGVDLTGAQLDGVDFRNAQLREAQIDGADNCTFDDAQMTEMQLFNCVKCSFRNVAFQEGTIWAMKECSFDGARVAQADLGGWTDCSAKNIELTEITIGHTGISRSDFTGAKMSFVNSFAAKARDSVFRKADLSGADLEHAAFERADLTGADLSRARLQKSNFTGASLSRATLVRADLHAAILFKVDLSKADLRDANLTGAFLKGATIDGADFQGANLYEANLSGLDLSKAKNLTTQQGSGGGAIGLHIRKLAQVAKSSAELETSAQLDYKGDRVFLRMKASNVMNHYFCGGRYTHCQENRNIHAEIAAPTFEKGMLNLANHWFGGKLLLDTIFVQASKSPLGKRELHALVTRAWCEAFGLEAPSDEQLARQEAAKKASLQQRREQALAELRGGAAGVQKWNAREERWKLGSFRRVDFSGLKLSRVDLESLDLQGATFDGASLYRASLWDSQLQGANFRNADLRQANLAGVKAGDANFEGARLGKCNLRAANFRRASFRAADLAGGDFLYSDLCGADLSEANLEGVTFLQTKYDEQTRLPAGFVPPEGMRWAGKGPDPRLAPPAPLAPPAGPLDFAAFMQRLALHTDQARLNKALQMLKADRFQLFADITADAVAGVVKSQTDPNLVYSCRLTSGGDFSCCTQNLNVCGGLRGAPCKHLLVLLAGLAKAGQLDPATADVWIQSSRGRKPTLDKDAMSETFLRYKGAEAGEVDWRPTETIPEDYYTL